MTIKRKKWGFIAVLAILSITVAGLFFGLKKLNSKERNETSNNFSIVSTGNIESVVTAQGKLEPKEYVDVGAQVSGQIEKLHVDIGAVVKNGDLIAEIDPEVYESRVAGDMARLKTLQAQKAEQKAQIKQAAQKFERNQTLIKDHAISQEVFEDAGTALDIAKAQLQSLEAQIEEAQSTLEGDKANLSYTKIYAPMDGTVVSQATKEGQTINASQTAPVIVQIANLDIMTVRAQVAEADISKLTPDMPVYFTTMGSQNRRWNAKIRQILPSPETVNDVVLYNVLVDVENKDHQLMTGMTTQMFFVLGKADNVLVIPANALLKRLAESDTDQGKAYQVNVLEEKIPAAKTVIVGLSDRTQAEIISGLKEGDKIIVPMTAETSSTPSQGRGMRMPRL
jgi:macrolide-specific efflux system membrane fusion protein